MKSPLILITALLLPLFVSAQYSHDQTRRKAFKTVTGSSLNNGLMSYWKFNEASGDTTDSVGTVTLLNNNSVTFVGGKINNAGSFTAVSSKCFSASNPSSVFLPNAMSVCAWVKLSSLPASSGSRMAIASKFVAGNTGWEMDIDTANNELRGLLSVTAGVNVTQRATTFGALSAGTWYFLAMTWDGSVLKVSVNAGVQDFTALTGTMAANSNDLNVGARPGGGGLYLDGLADEIGVWNRALTAAEITQLYNSGSGMTLP